MTSVPESLRAIVTKSTEGGSTDTDTKDDDVPVTDYVVRYSTRFFRHSHLPLAQGPTMPFSQ